MIRALLLILLALSLGACSHPIQKADVIGVYFLDNESSHYTLELKSDGTYVHSSEADKETGQWEWEDKEDYAKVCLDKFETFKGEGMGGSRGPSYCFFHPERSWKGIRFPIGDPDAPSHYFIKQK